MRNEAPSTHTVYGDVPVLSASFLKHDLQFAHRLSSKTAMLQTNIGFCHSMTPSQQFENLLLFY